MKTTYGYASLALALLNSGSAIAFTRRHRTPQSTTLSVSASATATTTSSAYPTATAPSNSTGNGPITAGTCNDCSGVCVTFGATNDDLYYWWNGGPGGQASTFGDKQIGSVCLTQAGAMFVGSTKDGESGVATGGANTKFEWAVSDTTSYFDISICDGFSVPMTCTGFQGNEGPYVTIGGGELCTNDCPADDKNGVNCRNLGAHSGNLASVPSCFKEGSGAEGKSGKNNYWLYDNLSVQAIFTGRTGVVCTVGDSSSSQSKRGLGQSAAELGATASKHRHQRRAAHGHGVHAIS